MSVVILGGNECMVRKYKDLCRSYQCSAKVISKMGGTLKNRLGNPDLLVMFTDTISHKMVQNALNETRGQDTVIIRSAPAPCLPWATSWRPTPAPRAESAKGDAVMSIDYVIQHAAPTLAGIKTGNLFPVPSPPPKTWCGTCGKSTAS